ncbi:MAG: SH3 domain-containing protein [Chloroflexota bacterium]
MNDNGRSRPYEEKEPIPWLWLGLGLIVTLISLAVAFAILRAFLLRPPLDVGAQPEPTIIILTAPPSATPAPTTAVSTPTPIPTFTPIPTPDNAIAPPEVRVGFYAVVANTGGVGLTIRGGPNTSNPPVTIAEEGGIVLVLAGPSEGNDLLWWQVELPDGTQGWGAADFLLPAAAP